MPHRATWEHIALFSNALAAAVLVSRLWYQGLARQYRFLTLLTAAELVQMLIFLPLKSHTTYALAYFITTPILWILYYAVVIELYRLILEDYPGISSIGRKAVTWSMILAVLISGASAIPSIDNVGTREFPLLRIFYTAERSVVLGLLLFLVLIQLFLFHYHLRLSRNRLIYSAGYAIYFGTTVASDVILGEILGGQVAVDFSLAVGIAGPLILLAGSILLTREGEARMVELEAHDTTPERARLQQQLVEMNRMLTKVARGG